MTKLTVGESELLENYIKAIEKRNQYLSDALADVLAVLNNPHQDHYYNRTIAKMIAEGALNGTWGRNDGTEVMLDASNIDELHEIFKRCSQPVLWEDS